MAHAGLFTAVSDAQLGVCRVMKITNSGLPSLFSSSGSQNAVDCDA
jgi:hypothetical protein